MFLVLDPSGGQGGCPCGDQKEPLCAGLTRSPGVLPQDHRLRGMWCDFTTRGASRGSWGVWWGHGLPSGQRAAEQ